VEDEIGDGAARLAKIRPMRVEMHLCVPVGAILAVAQNLSGTHKCIATDSGETISNEDDLRRPIY